MHRQDLSDLGKRVLSAASAEEMRVMKFEAGELELDESAYIASVLKQRVTLQRRRSRWQFAHCIAFPIAMFFVLRGVSMLAALVIPILAIGYGLYLDSKNQARLVNTADILLSLPGTRPLEVYFEDLSDFMPFWGRSVYFERFQKRFTAEAARPGFRFDLTPAGRRRFCTWVSYIVNVDTYRAPIPGVWRDDGVNSRFLAAVIENVDHIFNPQEARIIRKLAAKLEN